MTLDEVKPGSTVRLVRNGARGVVGQRLMDMGFFKGVTIKVVRNAPLVDPVEFLLGSQHVTVRHAEAATIEVEPI
ncbi:ferrous iron transport protein A [Dethiosulfovibrio sp. F2B]|uniref:FeoA family protein n=1 Tax=Dethiosulfovibrio faecalis TaxID=2720018 RepID=UPI001F2CC1BC|nr:ferrous iron transport protein A [Dethiosulfovibrio faecalis]MEA3285231.1 FeoA family protein [Synergistota bacterium]